MAGVAALSALLASAGCGTFFHGTLVHPTTTDDVWPATLAAAQAEARAGRSDAADSTLAAFATRFPGTHAALETSFWRGLYKLDPTNPHASLSAAMASLDAYLADSLARRDHVPEAQILRRTAGELADLNQLASTAITQAQTAKAQAAQSRAQAADVRASLDQPTSGEAEIRHLKDELANANAELERIRKRLAQTGKPPR